MFEFQWWDRGRLEVNREFSQILRVNGLTTFDAIASFEGGRVVKNLLRERTTTRIVLPADSGSEQCFYLKKHAPPPWKEYVKPFLRLTRPILGARNEWKAIIRFHEIGIPTMVPVAFGQSGRSSFVMTKSIEGCVKLSHWMENHDKENSRDDELAGRLVEHVARIARTMHTAGMHHQDFYLTHLLTPKSQADNGTGESTVFVIDLGRVCRRRRLIQRWIVKDLAQLNYSAPQLSRRNRLRFLETYLGRPLQGRDRSLLHRIERKTEAIARHSRKNGL